MDYRGLALIASGVALSVFGFQQSSIWGWGNPGIGLSIGAGLVLLVIFYFVELRTESPLMQVRIFRIRPFFVENLVLGVSMLAFIPVFFFASEYAQISLAKSASEAGLFLLYFFIGFVVAAQIGGRMLDRGGAKRPVVLGCVLAAVGFALWAGKVTQLSFGAQKWYIILAGAGMGFMLGPASTDAVNRASRLSYGEATGITQTVRELRGQPGPGHPGHGPGHPDALAGDHLAGGPGGARRPGAATRRRPSPRPRAGTAASASIPHFVRLDFADATRSVLIGMVGGHGRSPPVVGLIGLRGRRPGGDRSRRPIPTSPPAR